MKYLPLYYRWLKAGRIPERTCNGNTGGLCGLFDKDPLFQLLKPIGHELETRTIWGYWGLDGEGHIEIHQSTPFGPLRQNIVLFMAAMNGEL